MLYFATGHNFKGYSPDPDSLHVMTFDSDADATRGILEWVYDTIDRWAEEAYDSATFALDPNYEPQSDETPLNMWDDLLREVEADRDNAADFDPRCGFSYDTPDGYVVWAEYKTRAELEYDGWVFDEAGEVIGT